MTQAAQLAQMGSPGVSLGFKNRIINGAMMIDQRNGGAAITATDGGYTLDRWQAFTQPGIGAFTVEQSADAPAGHSRSVKMTVTSAAGSISSSHRYIFLQNIEGYNVADLNWGTANASAVTVSFWVKSSVAGTFSASLCLSFTPSVPLSFSIPNANTWTKISLTVNGPTSGSWSTTNSVGARLVFNLGLGSTYLGSNGVWDYSNALWGVTGQTNLILTNGATFCITGVQLEKGTASTSFDYRPYGTELALCQRYYEVLPVQSSAGFNLVAALYTGSNYWARWDFRVTKRAEATIGGGATYSSSWGSVSYALFNSTSGPWTCGASITASAEL